MPEPVTIKPFSDSALRPLDVADFYLNIQRGVEAAGQKTFDDIYEAWHELRYVEGNYVAPGNFWVAQNEQSQLVGCLGLQFEGNRTGLLGRLGVDEACRRQGIGSSLMETAIGWAGSHGFETLSLETSPKQYGMPLYKKLGFVSVGYASDGDDVMQLSLQ